MPVLSYEPPTSSQYDWLARLICGLVMLQGAMRVAGYGISFIPEPGSVVEHYWCDLPAAGCECALAVFGALGIFRMRGVRWFIISCFCLITLFGCISAIIFLREYPPNRHIVIAAALDMLDSFIMPTFVIICLMKEPIRGYFVAR